MGIVTARALTGDKRHINSFCYAPRRGRLQVAESVRGPEGCAQIKGRNGEALLGLSDVQTAEGSAAGG